MPANFTQEQKAEIRDRLFREGERLARQVGLKKMTISRLTQACGIAQGTFYQFFPSKENFVLAMIGRMNEEEDKQLMQLMNGRNTIPLKEIMEWYRSLFTFENNFLLCLTTEDFLWMKTHLSRDMIFNPMQDMAMAQGLLQMVEGIREDYDVGVVVNMIKSIYAMTENQDSFCKEALPVNISLVFDSLYRYLRKGEEEK